MCFSSKTSVTVCFVVVCEMLVPVPSGLCSALIGLLEYLSLISTLELDRDLGTTASSVWRLLQQ